MSQIRRHPVLTFFLLAYALCWAAIPWQSFFAPGVLVAALIVVSLTEGVAGLKAMGARLIRWRVSWVWYALAIAVPLSVKFASIALNSAAGAPVPDIPEFSVWYSLPMAIAINIVNPLNAQLPEESSFRGWAQPKLQLIRTPFAATVLMAVGVTIWHVPFFVMPQFGSSPIEALATIGVTFWYAWLFNHASGSSLLTLIAHATEGVIETSTLWPDAADTVRMTWLYSVVWGALAIALLVFDRGFWTRPPVPVDDQADSERDVDLSDRGTRSNGAPDRRVLRWLAGHGRPAMSIRPNRAILPFAPKSRSRSWPSGQGVLMTCSRTRATAITT